MKLAISILGACLASSLTFHSLAAPVQGWLNWRGPEQNGTSRETGLPDEIMAEDALWSGDFPGASTAAIALFPSTTHP